MFELFFVFLRFQIKFYTIRKFLKISLITLLVIFTLPATALLLLQNDQVQTGLTRFIASEISKTIGTEISVESVSVTFINRLQLKNIYLEDLNGDTLLYAKKVKLTLRQLNRLDKSISIGTLSLNDANIHLITDSTETINLKFIIDFIKGDKPENSRDGGWKVNFDNIALSGSHFRYTKDSLHTHEEGIDFMAMDIQDLNLQIEDFAITGDTIAYLIKKLEFNEVSGFNLKNLTANMSLSKRHMSFENIRFNTPYSEVSANSIDFNFNGFDEFSDYVNLVDNKFNIRSSLVNFNDIGYFAPVFMNYDEEFRLTGLVTGKIADLHADKILISYNEETLIETSFYMIGLPDFRETFMHFNFSRLQTSMKDIREISLPKGKKIPVPEKLNKLGKIKYAGEFTGYIDDFVTFGKFNTSLGEISSDILIKPDSRKGLSFQGELKTKSFNIGDFLDDEKLVGNVSLNLKVDGFTNPDSLQARLTGQIDSIELNSYIYENISLTGELADKTFDGSLNISDPNIQMNFLGKVDFSNELPEFRFTADVSRIRPYYLNIIKTNPEYFASFLLKTNFKGNNIDNLEGEINLVNSYFEKDDENIQVYNLKLQAINDADSGSIKIHSDILDAELKGRYRFSTLKSSIAYLANNYVPSLIKDSEMLSAPDSSYTNDFNFNIHLKNISSVVHFFLPKFNISNNSTFSGSFDPYKNDFHLNGEAAEVVFFGTAWEDFQISTNINSSNTEISAKGKSLVLKNKFKLENISMNTMAYNDTVLMKLDWHSETLPRYDGTLRFLADLAENPITGKSISHITLMPSLLTFNDSIWQISESKINIDSNAININSFSISNDEQLFMVSGKISSSPEDSLYFRLNNFDLSSLNILTKKSKMELQGNITGNLTLSDLHHEPVILSHLVMKDLIVNNEKLGNGKINAYWNGEEEKINILVDVDQEESDILSMKGDYFPKDGKLDFKIDFNKIKLNTFLPFLEKNVSDIKGLGSGKLTLEGNLKQPDFNGEINLFKASVKVDYLQTRYHLSTTAKVKGNNFILDEFDLFDEKGNKAKAQGRINTHYLKDMAFNFRIQTDNFMFLNTNEYDNELFYGNVYAAGIVNINGPLDNIRMTINARTGRNSVFYLPLYTVGEVNESDFITFRSRDSDENKDYSKTQKYEVRMKGLAMDFNLEITPEAQVQLIFDPVIGDILKGRGTGNLKLGVNTLGKFEIFGDILIENGDYLFTLQNVINKRFEVKPGGRISWNGDPADANIELEAFYPIRTSVYNLALGFNYDANSTELESLKKRIPVECQIMMTGKLLEPTLKPDIELPTADPQTRNIVQNSISTEEDLMVQFLSLLVINNFISTQNINNPGSGTRNTAFEAGFATTSELLTNQFNRLLSQLSKDLDIGLNYRPGNEINNDELEVALSTQILNDRVSLNGNLDVGGTQQTTANVQNTNNIVGDFEVDVKITKNGKFHVKAFNRSNDNLLVYTSPYTQGVGVMYKEDFNSVGELLRRYKDAVIRLFRSKDKEKSKNKN